MINYLIVDDEPIAHDIIIGYCDLLPNMTFSKSCYDAIEALQFLNTNTVHLIFLDINMPKLKGFDFLKSLQNPPKIIVTTAYKDYALEGFELNVVDYLLKPFSFERFVKAVYKVSENNEKLRSEPLSAVKSDSIFVKSGKKQIQINLSEILFMESSGNYCKITLDSRTILTRAKISELIEKISRKHFVQTHKSFVVAKLRINSIEGNSVVIGTHKIPIGKMYKENILSLIKQTPNS